MQALLKNFAKGILTIVPIVLVVYVIYSAFIFFDGILGNFLKDYLKESYVPGVGLLLTIILITILGWLTTKYITGQIYRITDRVLEKIPIVKTIYSVIKDTINSFLGEKKSFSKVVLITHAGSEMKSVGFLTAENVGVFYEPLSEYVAVYIPQTFQVAGFTFLVPKANIEIINVKPEDAMKFVLSGGMTSSKRESEREQI